MAFDPSAHIIKLKGKDYLEVKFRLVWFREDHPAESGWGINTSIVQFDEKQGTVKATITDPEGRIAATGTKQEVPKDFGDYLEKAETGAIGRALALLGYGTQFAPEMEEGQRIVDSPVERNHTEKPPGLNLPGPGVKPPIGKSPADKPAEGPPAADPITKETVIAILAERTKREGGWAHIFPVLSEKGMPSITGKPAAEQKATVLEYMSKLTEAEAQTLLAKLVALPAAPPKTKPASQGGQS